MTTEAAAKLYEAQHNFQMEGKGYAVYNPLNKSLYKLPFIYGFNNGGSPGWYSAVLLSEDGKGLGGHLCSSEAYMPHDLGLFEGTRPDRHEDFQKHYPEGYRMAWIDSEEVRNLSLHPRFQEAIKLAQEES